MILISPKDVLKTYKNACNNYGNPLYSLFSTSKFAYVKIIIIEKIKVNIKNEVMNGTKSIKAFSKMETKMQ